MFICELQKMDPALRSYSTGLSHCKKLSSCGPAPGDTTDVLSPWCPMLDWARNAEVTIKCAVINCSSRYSACGGIGETDTRILYFCGLELVSSSLESLPKANSSLKMQYVVKKGFIGKVD